MTNLMDPLASLVWAAWRFVLEDTAITLVVCLLVSAALASLRHTLSENDKPDPGAELVTVIVLLASLLAAAFFGVATMAAVVIAQGRGDLVYLHPWLDGVLPAACALLVGLLFGGALTGLFLRLVNSVRNRFMQLVHTLQTRRRKRTVEDFASTETGG